MHKKIVPQLSLNYRLKIACLWSFQQEIHNKLSDLIEYMSGYTQYPQLNDTQLWITNEYVHLNASHRNSD